MSRDKGTRALWIFFSGGNWPRRVVTTRLPRMCRPNVCRVTKRGDFLKFSARFVTLHTYPPNEQKGGPWCTPRNTPRQTVPVRTRRLPKKYSRIRHTVCQSCALPKKERMRSYGEEETSNENGKKRLSARREPEPLSLAMFFILFQANFHAASV